METVWIALGALALSVVVYLVRLTWQLRGVSDMAEQALAVAGDAVPKAEWSLSERRHDETLERIDTTLGQIWTRLDVLTDTDRLATVEAKVEIIEKRLNGSGP